jgi:putative chitinase
VKIDLKRFFEQFRKAFGPLSSEQVRGLDSMLASIQADPHMTDPRWSAYALATAYHETAHTFLPIKEYGGRAYFIRNYGGHTAKGKRLGNDTAEEGATYAGRGLVQLTGEDNYERAEEDLRREYPEIVAEFERRTGKTFDLSVGDQPNDEKDADNAMDSAIAYCILSYGMRHGRFTGKKLTDYISGSICNYLGARRIINSTDKDSLIAQYAVKFERCLRGALEAE